GKGRVLPRRPVLEEKYAAVIAARKGHDLLAPGHHARRGERHEVGLGPGVAEAHALEGGEAPAERGGETRLVLDVPAMHPAARERALDRGADRRVGVAEEP